VYTTPDAKLPSGGRPGIEGGPEKHQAVACGSAGSSLSVLVLLFIKYVSDKYAAVRYAPIIIPKGSTFKDMAALKGKPDIGDQINKKIVAPLFAANKLSDPPDFNSAEKLGDGKEKVERLTNLIGISRRCSGRGRRGAGCRRPCRCS
jgi:hypothetical protein